MYGCLVNEVVEDVFMGGQAQCEVTVLPLCDECEWPVAPRVCRRAISGKIHGYHDKLRMFR